MPYGQRMEDEAPASDYSGLPGVHVSADQIVARNMRHWRRVAGLTQEELGERIGWTAANVSAVERSADPGRDKRRLDAQAITGIAKALDLPIAALFLPPADDGIAVRYQFHADPHECSGMAELVSLLVSDPSEDDTPVMDAYRERYIAVLAAYLDPGRGEELAAYLGDLTTAEQRASRLERLRWQREALAAMVGDIDGMVDAITDAGSAH